MGQRRLEELRGLLWSSLAGKMTLALVGEDLQRSEHAILRISENTRYFQDLSSNTRDNVQDNGR